MKSSRILASLNLVIYIVLAGCTNYQIQGKSYNSVLINVKSDNVIITPPVAANNDFIKTISINLKDLTEKDVTKMGNLHTVQKCGPKVLEVISSVRSLSISGSYDISGGMFGFHGESKDKMTLSTTGEFIDCVTGKVIGSFEHREEDNDLFKMLSAIARDTAKDSYKQILKEETVP